MTTEREYCRDLKLTWQAFSLDDPDVLEQKQIDVKGRDFEKEKSVKSRQKSCLEIQVNLCQKYLFTRQLTHNMTTDCSMNYEFSTKKFQDENKFCTQIVLNLYENLTQVSIA